MDEHGRYFQEHFAAGRVLLFIPWLRQAVALGEGRAEQVRRSSMLVSAACAKAQKLARLSVAPSKRGLMESNLPERLQCSIEGCCFGPPNTAQLQRKFIS